MNRALANPIYIGSVKTWHSGRSVRLRFLQTELEVVLGRPPWLCHYPRVGLHVKRMADGVRAYATVRPFQLRVTFRPSRRWLPRRHKIYRCPQCQFEASRVTFVQRGDG